MRIEFEKPGPFPAGGDAAPHEIHVLARVLDGWILDATFTLAPDGPRLTSARFDADAASPPALSNRLLRDLRLGAVQDELDAWLRDWLVRTHLGDEWSRPVKRPGRAGRDARDYLVWARRYVDALQDAPRAPVKAIVEAELARGEHCTAAEVRAYVNEARNRGLLTDAPPGRAGGELTPRALELLAQIDRETRKVNR